MANGNNVYTGRIYELDTAEHITGTIVVSRIEFHPATTDSDLLIEDSAGNTIWKIRATAAAANSESYGLEIRTYNPPEKIRGLNLVTIDDGWVYVHKTDSSP